MESVGVLHNTVTEILSRFTPNVRVLEKGSFRRGSPVVEDGPRYDGEIDRTSADRLTGQSRRSKPGVLPC